MARSNTIARRGARFAVSNPGAHQQSVRNVTKDELSDTFIEFLKSSLGNEYSTDEHLRKRQKLSSEGSDFEHIVVKRTTLFVKFSVSEQRLQEVIERHKLPILVTITETSSKIYHLEIYDVSNKSHRLILDVHVPADDVPLQDIQIATLVGVEAGRWRNPQGQGRLWTETDVRLGYNDASDYLEINFTVKWNTTSSLSYLSRRRVDRPALKAVLTAYFPGVCCEQDNKSWSPQNFYESVYIPEKQDELASSIVTDQLTTQLYPFQKRSVQWLLKREGVQWSGNRRISNFPAESRTKDLPYSFHQGTDDNGQICFISSLFNVVVKDVEPYKQLETLRGGILAEEMGLGKTVEIIALITLHQRSERAFATTLDPYISDEVRPTPATLIITPPSILPQWITEISRHSPGLKVMHYKGIKAHKRLDTIQLLEKLAAYDIVLTTYNVLSSEIHYALPSPDRQLRGERKYDRPKSPLMQLSWWRVCLDEAQMIESGVSNAATVARLIPRVNAWGITGTPVQKDVADLLGLLIFLRLEPLASIHHLWISLVSRHQSSFQAIFKQLALRHTKQSVREELRLPPQQRLIITMPFTPVEEQHYQSLFQQMCEDCGVDLHGTPLRDDWDPEESGIIEQMRTWLVRLRQTALHPEVGGRNRRALGHKDGPLRTVNDVLTAMLEQSEVSLRTDQRALLLCKLKRGQTLENGPEVKKALKIWTEVLHEANEIVLECRQQLHKEISGSREEEVEVSSNVTDDSSENETQSNNNEDSTEMSARIGTFRNRLRAALEIQHVAVFFQANAYFQIKSNEAMTEPDSQDFKELERLETEGYELAKSIRQEILKEIFHKTNKLMRRISKKALTEAFVQIPEFPSSSPRGGIESHRIMEQLNQLGVALDAQANHLDEWREQVIKLLLRPLVDEDEGLEITGDEYEESTKTQDEVMVFVLALRTVIEDRYDALTGQDNLLVSGEVKSALKLAQEGEGAFPERVLDLLKIRAQVKPSKDMGSVRAITSDLRALATNLRIDAENGSSRAANELAIVELERHRIQNQYSQQNKAVIALRQEIDLFTSAMNMRLEYYRQLQQVSDMVAPLEQTEGNRSIDHMVAEEERLVKKIATASAKRRYLIHLRDEATADPTQRRMCVICQSTFELGALTVCGHQFCKDCMGLWWSAHHNCPVCKKKLTQNDLHDITYKPQELKMAEEMVEAPQERSPASDAKKSAIYSEISNNTLTQIKNIDLDGPSFTTKIDALARHLIWLRESDPGAKSIVFSQFKDFLDVLARALATFRIGFTTIDKSGGIEQFKTDPGVECFLLHARAHSSGLNLVNASHVFLCEPLINTALELQAIARVDRIGQQQATTVYLLLIEGTVEESIYEISVRRRLEHMGQRGKGKANELTPELLDSSNSMEMQYAPLAKLLTKSRTEGEIVDKGDLWSCLFGNRVSENHVPHSDTPNREVRRHLGAEAAEERRLDG